MAWTIVGVGPATEVNTTTLTLNEPAGVAAGDLIVACIAGRGYASGAAWVTVPSAWTAVDRVGNANTATTTSGLANGAMFYVVRGASSPGYTFNFTGTASVATGRVVAYRGNTTTTPLDAQTAVTTPVATTSVSVTGLTTTQADDLIVAMTAGGIEAVWSAFSNVTTPIGASSATNATSAPSTTTWTERAEYMTLTGADTSLAIFDAVRTGIGATGNLTATASLGAGHVVIAAAFKIAPPGVTVSVTGVAAIGAVGTATASGGAAQNVSSLVEGVAAIGAVGTATAKSNASTLVTGSAGTGAAGTVGVIARISMGSVRRDVSQLAPLEMVEMFIWDDTVIGGANVIRWHPGTTVAEQPIVWQGEVYTAMAIEAEGFEMTGAGKLPRPTVRAANIGGVLGSYLRSMADGLGAKVTRKRTLGRYLDAVNFPGGSNPYADPYTGFPDEIFYVSRKALENPIFIELELAVPFDVEGILLPRRQVIAGTCQWVYRSAECTYAGPPVQDIDGNPTIDPARDACRKTLNACKARFGADVLHTSAFPASMLARYA